MLADRPHGWANARTAQLVEQRKVILEAIDAPTCLASANDDGGERLIDHWPWLSTR
jgi:hypothetical protein